MAGVWSFLTILKVVVEEAVVVVVDVGVVEVRTWSVMNVVSLVILLGNVVCALVQGAWEVGVVEALALDIVGVQVMGIGAYSFFLVCFVFISF